MTGGSPRYHICPTSDGRHIACAALEQKFWDRLVDLVGLDGKFHDDAGQEQAVTVALSEIFAQQPAGYWRELLGSEDVCTVVVATWDEAVRSGLVDTDAPERVSRPGAPDESFATLASSVDPSLRQVGGTQPYPALESLPDSSPWS